MVFRHEYLGGAWIDIEQPTEDEIHQIAREFSISDRIEKELNLPTPAPLVTRDANAALLVLHFPTHGIEDGDTKNQEVDFVVGNNFLITVRYEVVTPLHHLKKLLEAQQIVDGHVPISTDVLLEILFAHLYTSVRDHTNHTANHIEIIERDMFDGHERQTVRLISSVGREFLHMESALANQESPLARFLKLVQHADFFGSDFSDGAERILSERSQIAQLIKTHRAITAELRETNIALLEARQNEIMKTLTVINFIFLPMGLISWTFSMRAEGMPLISSPNSFWILLGIMMATGAFLTLYAARKRWLS